MRTFAPIMIDVVSIVQVKAYARQGGLFLSLAWLVSFALILLVPKSSWGGLVAMSSPFLVGWLLQRFRNEALDGAISFRRALVFSCLTFFYASMIFALAQYVYFRFLDHGLFLTNIVNQAGLLAEVYKQNGMPTTDSILCSNSHGHFSRDHHTNVACRSRLSPAKVFHQQSQQLN